MSAFVQGEAPRTSLRKADLYSRECTKQGIVPLSLEAAARVMTKQPSSQALVGDRQVAAWCSAGLLSDQPEIQLRDADVGEEGARALAQRLGILATTLDLAGNCIGARGAEALGAARMPNLESLVLSRNGLGDVALGLLCAGLSMPEAPQLVRLSLSENQISRNGRALGDMLRTQRRLSMLDLHWNYLTGDSALGLFEGVEANSSGGGSLARLDLSWNCLGNSGGLGAMQSLAVALKSQSAALVHLDLSYNGLRCEECRVLGAGLRDNHSLLGLHLVGNSADVDADGFVIPSDVKRQQLAGLRPAAGPTSAPRELGAATKGVPPRVITEEEKEGIRACFRQIDTDGSGTIEACELQTAMNSLGLTTSLEEAEGHIARAAPGGCGCLGPDAFADLMEALILKERQREWESGRQKMEMDRDRSSLEARTSCWICESWQSVEISHEGGGASAVWVFLSVDNYQKATRLTKDEDGKFSCQRMLPPDQIFAVLQVDHGAGLVAGLETHVLQEPLTIRLRQAEELPPKDGGGPVDIEVSEVSVLQLGGRKKNCRSSAPAVPKRAVVVDDPANPGGFCVKPRITESEFRAKRQKVPWSFERSMFASWRFENAKLHAAAFSADWPHTKVHKFLKERSEQDEAGEALRAHYAAFLRLYRRCAASSSDGSTASGVSMNVCADVLLQAGVLDDQYCRLADVDTMFIAARVREKGADKRPMAVKAGDTLLRFQFVEFLLRVAVARYVRTKVVSSMKSAVDCLFEALEAQVRPIVGDLESFQAEFHSEECDTVLRKHESGLVATFKAYSGRWAKPGEERMMCCKEFEALLSSVDAFNESFPARDVPYAFAMGLQLYPDELFNLDFAQMTFLEFLHGVGAAVYLRRGAGPLSDRLATLVGRLVQGQGLAGLLRGLR